MGLACTLLGHRYGDVELEHDREERGEEVVTVTREVATCERCGQEHVLSENTEITSIVDPGDVGAEGDAAPEPDAPAGEADETGEGDTSGGDADSRSVDDGTGRPAPGADAGDAEVLEESGSDDSGVPERDVADAGATEPSPPVDAADPDADGDGDDAVILDDNDDDERGYGEWPGTDPEDDPTSDADDGDRPDGAEAAAREAEERVFEEIDPAVDVPEALRCPACGFRAEGQGTPLRAGDACPDCGDAYLDAEDRDRAP